jgi:hypothetical protein
MINNGVCASTSDLVQIKTDCGLGLKGSEHLNSNLIQIIPNPVNNRLNVDLGDNRSAESIEILNQMGVKVLDVSVSNTTIDVSVLNAGVYILKVLDTNGAVYRTKFIKE